MVNVENKRATLFEDAHENSSTWTAPFDGVDTGKLDKKPPFMLGDLDRGLLVLFPLISTWLLEAAALHRWGSGEVC